MTSCENAQRRGEMDLYEIPECGRSEHSPVIAENSSWITDMDMICIRYVNCVQENQQVKSRSPRPAQPMSVSNEGSRVTAHLHGVGVNHVSLHDLEDTSGEILLISHGLPQSSTHHTQQSVLYFRVAVHQPKLIQEMSDQRRVGCLHIPPIRHRIRIRRFTS